MSKKAEKRGILISAKGELVKLRRDATIFGRDKADIIVDDPEVSATHCQIQNINDIYHIFDMNSTNGTFVNGERIVKAKLKENDNIAIGRSTFRFAMEDENKVRHIPTLFKSQKTQEKSSSIVDTLIESELKVARAMTLSVTYASGERETIELSQRLIYIGRATSFGKFDQDPEISRKHLLIKLNDTGEVFIEDQGSTNGSFLNGKRLSGMQPVKPGDEIRVGDTFFTIILKKNAST